MSFRFIVFHTLSMLYPCFIYALFLLYNSIFSDEKKVRLEHSDTSLMRCGANSRKNRRLCKPHLTSDFKAFYFLLLLAGSGAAIEAPVKQCVTKLYLCWIVRLQKNSPEPALKKLVKNGVITE
jgi:hypothetical protein